MAGSGSQQLLQFLRCCPIAFIGMASSGMGDGFFSQDTGDDNYCCKGVYSTHTSQKRYIHEVEMLIIFIFSGASELEHPHQAKER